MSYQVLARKWRPQTFSELVGQQHVVDAISNALENDKLHHAYLFTGTRGVGKTTIARIFSKSLNCETGQSANPCGKCDTCLDISEGRFVDLLEIDAASRTKVEDTRELLDNVQYKPTRGKYKVYLIDEVHMLSKHSFNALLKTLEEPPPHVKFLLATTDPQKLPVTILSRCLQFSLKALSREQIQNQLATILEAEKIQFEKSALTQLARAASGSMRDALSLTDQAIAQGNNHVSADVVVKMLGLLDKNQILRLTKCICERDAAGAMEQLDEICADSPDYSQVLQQLLALLHQIALTQIVPDVCKLDTNAAKPVYTLAQALSAEHIQLLYQIALNGQRDLPHAPDPLSGLQMTIMRMLAFTPAQSIPFSTGQLINSGSSDLVEPNSPQLSASQSDSLKTASTHSALTQSASTHSALTEASASESGEPEVSVPSLDEAGSNLTAVSNDSPIPDTATQEVRDEVLVGSAYAQEEHPQQAESFVHPQETTESNELFDTSSSVEQEDSFAHLQSLMDMEQDLASYEQEALGGGQVKKSDADKPSQQAEPQDINTVDAQAEPEQEFEIAQEQTAPIESLIPKRELSDPQVSSIAPQETTQPSPSIQALTQTAEQASAQAPSQQHDESSTTPLIQAFLSDGSKLLKASQIDKWSAFVDSLDVRGLARQLLIHGRSTGIKDQCLRLNLSESHKHLSEQSTVQNVKEALKAKFNRDIEVEVQYTEVKASPYQIQQDIDKMRLDHAVQTVDTDPAIQELVKAFDAEIIPDSIAPR